ncbi:MAG TPA: cytidine deaminase [Candidatus Nanoarchaeia archaeon]|nr:cytidine deaminase [Candidatus Nanoarchaeia archaeon]
MSAAFAARQTYSEFEAAKAALKLSWLKRETTKWSSGSVAITKNGVHAAGLMESRTNLLDITSEQGAIALAVSRKDPHVEQVVSVIQGEYDENPLVIKVLGDHARRTGTPIKYTIFNEVGKALLELSDVAQKYNPSPKPLDKIKSWSPCANSTKLKTDEDKIAQLRNAALQGMETHFSSDSKTSYGSSVLANGKLYFGGVYSSFDHRMNLHSEMVATLGAIMDGNREIEMVGIISDKFVDELPHMCGCCRQFFSEIQEKTKQEIEVVVFSFDGKQTFRIKLNDYFPSSWSSGLSFDERKKSERL